METEVLISTSELLELASKRIKLPSRKPLLVKYDGEVDALFLKYATNKSVQSKSLDEDGIIYDFDIDNNIVGIEILDLQGLFA